MKLLCWSIRYIKMLVQLFILIIQYYIVIIKSLHSFTNSLTETCGAVTFLKMLTVSASGFTTWFVLIYFNSFLPPALFGSINYTLTSYYKFIFLQCMYQNITNFSPPLTRTEINVDSICTIMSVYSKVVFFIYKSKCVS